MTPKRAQLREVHLHRAGPRHVPAPAAAGARMPRLIAGPADAADILARLKIAVIGAGSIGGRLAKVLAHQQPQTLWVVDPKAYKAESCLTHDLPPGEVMRGAKAPHVARQVKAISPATRVLACVGGLEQLPLPAMSEADFWVIATDNLAVEMEAGVRAMRLGIPLLQAAVHGESLVAQVRLYANKDGTGPCPACSWGALEFDLLNRQVEFSCAGQAAEPGLGRVVAPPTRSLAALCALAADLAALRLFRRALGLGEAADDTLEEFSGYAARATRAPLRRNPDCRCEHQRLARRPSPRPLAACTPAELASLAGFAGASGVVSLLVDDFCWIESGVCHCPELASLGRFAPANGRRLWRCPTCRAPIHPHPLRRHWETPLPLFGAAAHRPLGRLGAAGARWVVARHEEQGALITDMEKEPTA